MKTKLFWLSIVIVILSWVGNTYYYSAKQIDEPIILKHYYDKEFYEMMSFPIYFISNLHDQSEVMYGIVDGVYLYPDKPFFPTLWNGNEQQIMFYQQFSHQGIQMVHFQIQQYDFEDKKDENGVWSFSEMMLVFRNGQQVTQNIGEIILREREESEREQFNPDEQAYRSAFSSSSSDGYSKDGFDMLTDGVIHEITIPFAEQLSDFTDIQIKIGGTEIEWTKEGNDWRFANKDGEVFPIQVKEGNRITVDTYMTGNNEYALETPIKIIGETLEGKPFTLHSYLYQNIHFSKEKLNDVIAHYEGSEN